jgi:hypothetical protein
MTHDPACELHTLFTGMTRCAFPECWAMNGHCHCGSRLFPPCVGCRDGRHLQHKPHVDNIDRACACDLCTEEAA